VKVRIVATETIVYRREFDLEELETQAEVTLEDIEIAKRTELPGRPEHVILESAWQAFLALVIRNHDDDFQQRLERHGDVQGQDWEFTKLEEKPVVADVEKITLDGMNAGAHELFQIRTDMAASTVELVMNTVRSDWNSGHEERAFEVLKHWVDLTGAYRIIAAMKAASTKETS
jgi:hypothetical protein